MTLLQKGLIVLAVQTALVLTTAGKYSWERHTRPMVWTRAQLFGEMMMEENAQSRYARVYAYADACLLPPKAPEMEEDFENTQNASDLEHPKQFKVRKGRVRTIAKDGHLVMVDAGDFAAHGTQEMRWDMRQPCTQARLLDEIEFYVPAGSSLPLELKPGQSLWALVTVPSQGDPRPIELAISDATGFHPLRGK
jgi:hypothetical protein